MKLLEQAPDWLLRPLPLNAADDASVNKEIDDLAKGLPDTIFAIHALLDRESDRNIYDSASNRASAYVWRFVDQFYEHPSINIRRGLLEFALHHMSLPARNRILRRLCKDPKVSLRTRIQRTIASEPIHEVALPASKQGSNWDATGWLSGTLNVPFSRHRQGTRRQKQVGVPPISTLGDLRELLAIRSEKQLGYFLLATHQNNGPYHTFEIPKRDGGKRTICAPRDQLRWVQRRILSNILSKVEPHSAAHGFIEGRSTVTNAEPHLGADVLLKFDLKDFFPTIHFYRVLGLLARLGYTVDDAKFGNEDESRQVAPTLARLCCYSPDATKWGSAALPQGAPTSPVISNLVCRRLDARLEGLAKTNKGTYTRYADDLTFSFKKPRVSLGRFRWWVDQICHQEGFFVKQSKFRVIRSSQRQVVTGIVVNEELRIPRPERRRFRAILHNCQKHGIESQARGHPRFREYLKGFASYLNMVHPEEGKPILDEVLGLLAAEGDS